MTREEATKRWRIKLNAAHLMIYGRPLGVLGKRYMERPETLPVHWQQMSEHDQRCGRKMAYVEDVTAIGLRFVGRVEAESYGSVNTWAKRETCGWYTNDDGESYKDGDGLCWGIVYQLPASNHGKQRLRFVAGYVMGGWDKGVTLDFGHIFTDVRVSSNEGATDTNGALEAAKHADEMAREAAEEEREYQRQYREEQDAEEAEDELEDA
jgi:hypothetical protein